MIEKMSRLEKALGGKLEKKHERAVPGLNDNDSCSTIYFSVPEGQSASALFREITNFANPPSAQSGSAIEAGCIISTPTRLVFYALEIHGDLPGWRADIEAGAVAKDVSLAVIRDDYLKVENGQMFPLADCQIDFI